MLVVDQLEGILVNLSRGQHVGHTLDQVRNVGPARFLVGLVFPEGHRRGLAARAVHPPVSVVEPRPHSDGRNVYVLEDSDAFLHLLWLNLDSHYPGEHCTSPPSGPSSRRLGSRKLGSTGPADIRPVGTKTPRREARRAFDAMAPSRPAPDASPHSPARSGRS